MGLLDTIKEEDRIQMKFSTFYSMVKSAAQCELVMNAVNTDVPHHFIRQMATGKKEEVKKEPTALESLGKATLGMIVKDLVEHDKMLEQESGGECKGDCEGDCEGCREKAGGDRPEPEYPKRRVRED